MSSLCDRFVFKQKTAYELRISDWSSDVCSSDLSRRERGPGAGGVVVGGGGVQRDAGAGGDLITEHEAGQELGAVAARGLVAEGEQCWPPGDAGVPLGQAVPVVGVERVAAPGAAQRSDERRVGKECVRTCRSRGSPYH